MFDFDGTMVDSEPVHYESMMKALGEHNKKYVSFDDHRKLYMGTGLHYVASLEIKRHNLELNVDDLIKSFNSHLKKLIETKGILPMAGIIELLKKAKSKGFKLAVVSGSLSDLVEYTLRKSRIPNVFDEIIGIDKFITPKPDPRCYFSASEMLKVKTTECLVFEDAENGINAAKNAKMTVVAVGENIKKEIVRNTDPNIKLIKDFTGIELI